MSESIRITLDWWGKCRSCAFYGGSRTDAGLAPGPCLKEDSPNHGSQVCHDGYCPKWDPFDEEVAFAILSLEERDGVRWGIIPFERVVELVNGEIDCTDKIV